MVLTQLQQDLIFGTLLGDGNLSSETAGRTWCYRATQKAAHEPYVQHKYNILKNYCNTGLIYGQIYDERTGKTYYRYYFNTLIHPDFRFFANMFYTYDGKTGKFKKSVPNNQNLNKFLTPRAIAYMYMDDGALKWLNHSNGMRICSESFQKSDIERLRKLMFEKFKLKTNQKPHTRNGEYVGDRINILEEGAPVLRDLIKPYLVDCMKYKVSDGNKGHL